MTLAITKPQRYKSAEENSRRRPWCMALLALDYSISVIIKGYSLQIKIAKTLIH